MSLPAARTEPPRLFPVEDGPWGYTLDETVLGVLAEPLRSRCVICEGALEIVSGGVRCMRCGTELLVGAEPVTAWIA